MALNHNILLETGTNEFEIVEFIMNANNTAYHFCINVAKVREVIRFPEVIRVPDAHKAVIGTANIRNHLVPIIDLGYWLGLREQTDIQDSKVILTFFNGVHNGFMVDEVLRIHRITWADIKDYSSMTNFNMVASVLGVVDIQGNMLQLLDFESIVNDINPKNALKTAEIDQSKAHLRSSHTVFLAEDSPVIRRVLLDTFLKAGYKAEVFENGAKILEALNKKMPDLIITDLEMPMVSGDYVVKKVREKMTSKELPIIVFSSMASEENEKKLLGIGANIFISKPELPLLVSLVDEHLIQ